MGKLREHNFGFVCGCVTLRTSMYIGLLWVFLISVASVVSGLTLSNLVFLGGFVTFTHLMVVVLGVLGAIATIIAFFGMYEGEVVQVDYLRNYLFLRIPLIVIVHAIDTNRLGSCGDEQNIAFNASVGYIEATGNCAHALFYYSVISFVDIALTCFVTSLVCRWRQAMLYGVPLVAFDNISPLGAYARIMEAVSLDDGQNASYGTEAVWGDPRFHSVPKKGDELKSSKQIDVSAVKSGVPPPPEPAPFGTLITDEPRAPETFQKYNTLVFQTIRPGSHPVVGPFESGVADQSELYGTMPPRGNQTLQPSERYATIPPQPEFSTLPPQQIGSGCQTLPPLSGPFQSRAVGFDTVPPSSGPFESRAVGFDTVPPSSGPFESRAVGFDTVPPSSGPFESRAVGFDTMMSPSSPFQSRGSGLDTLPSLTSPFQSRQADGLQSHGDMVQSSMFGTSAQFHTQTAQAQFQSRQLGALQSQNSQPNVCNSSALDAPVEPPPSGQSVRFATMMRTP